MRYTHYFWDFDGTLFDTYPRILRACHKGFVDCGYSFTPEELYPYIKKSLPTAWKHFAPERYQEVRQAYHLHAEEEPYDSMKPYEGVERMLQAVVENGGHNYLYTLRGSSAVPALEHYGLIKYFRDFVSMEDGFAVKPAPDALNYLKNKYRLDPDTCVMIGDRDIDIGSGVNAGMHGVMFDPEHFYDDYPADCHFYNFFDMLSTLVWENKADDLHIEDLYTMQVRLQKQFEAKWGGITPTRTKEQLLWLVGEVGEVVDILKKNSMQKIATHPELKEHLAEELADVSMYLFDVLLCSGISREDFSRVYLEKHLKNMGRDYTAEHIQKYGK